MMKKTCVVDAMDKSCRDEFLEDVEYLLKGRKLDYFVLQHMEPDHASSALALLEKYPDAKIIGQPQTFKLFEQFFRHPHDGPLRCRQRRRPAGFGQAHLAVRQGSYGPLAGSHHVL